MMGYPWNKPQYCIVSTKYFCFRQCSPSFLRCTILLQQNFPWVSIPRLPVELSETVRYFERPSGSLSRVQKNSGAKSFHNFQGNSSQFPCTGIILLCLRGPQNPYNRGHSLLYIMAEAEAEPDLSGIDERILTKPLKTLLILSACSR